MRVSEYPLHLQQAFLQLSGSNTPDPAPAGAARLWYDQANGALKFSVNGGAFSAAPNSLRLRDLTEHKLVAAPTAAAATALLLLDSGTFAGSANGTMLGINLHTGTADLIKAQKAGADRFTLSETGILTTLKGIFGGTTSLGQLTVVAPDGDTTTGVFKTGAALPSVNWWEIQNSGGTPVFFLSHGGGTPFMQIAPQLYGFFFNGQVSVNHRMGSTADTATAIPMVAKGAAAQTANLIEALNSAGDIQVAIGPAGQLKTANTAAGNTLGSVVASLEIFDAAGVSVGKLPLYDDITVT